MLIVIILLIVMVSVIFAWALGDIRKTLERIEDKLNSL